MVPLGIVKCQSFFAKMICGCLERERLRQRVLLTYPGIRSVTLYRNDWRLVNVNFSKDAPIPRDVLESSPIYGEVLRRNGMPVWIGPNEDRRLTGDNNLFTQIRVLLDIDTLNSKGILVTRFQSNELSRIFSFYGGQDNRNRRFLVVGGGGEIIFDSGCAAEGAKLGDYVGDGRQPRLDGDGFRSDCRSTDRKLSSPWPIWDWSGLARPAGIASSSATCRPACR